MERHNLKIAKLWHETPHILAVELRAPDGGELPAFDAGAHLNVFLPNGIARQYSLANGPGEHSRYLLGILRERESRGGSAWIHDNLEVGGSLEVSEPLNNFPLREGAERYLLIAGGIGITPILSMIEVLSRRDADFQLYYCTRSAEETAFRERLSDPALEGRVTFVHDGGDPSKGLDLQALLTSHEDGTHLYCCGPAGLMGAVKAASDHWPAGTVHFEWFAVDESQQEESGEAKAFTVVIASTGQELSVPADRTVLEVLTDAGFSIDSVCREGICGSCIVDVLEGEVEHHDMILDDDEKASNSLMTTCCSRAKTDRLVLDL